MITIPITIHEIPILATITESTGTGFFASRVRRYLRETINSIPILTEESVAYVNLDEWIAIWLLSTLYMSEVDGPSQSLMHKIEDGLVAAQQIPQETTDPYIIVT